MKMLHLIAAGASLIEWISPKKDEEQGRRDQIRDNFDEVEGLILDYGKI